MFLLADNVKSIEKKIVKALETGFENIAAAIGKAGRGQQPRLDVPGDPIKGALTNSDRMVNLKQIIRSAMRYAI